MYKIKDSARGWNFLHENTTEYDTSKDDLEFIFSFIKNQAKDKVLDIGCGKFLSSIHGKKRGLDFYGCDISSVAINSMKIKNKDLDKVIVANSQNLPWERDYFDTVIAISSLDNMSFEEAQSTVSESNRVLKPKGSLLAVLKSEDTDKFKGFYQDKRLMVRKNVQVTQNKYTKLKILRLFEPLFQILVFKKINLADGKDGSHWLVLLQKR